MPDPVAWCVLASFRITSVFVRLAFQFLESACDFMINVLRDYLSKDTKSKSIDSRRKILSFRKGKISRDTDYRREAGTSNSSCNLSDRIGLIPKSSIYDETNDSTYNRQQGADYLPTRGFSFNGSEIFECNLRHARKVTVMFEFLPAEDNSSSTQFVDSETDHADRSSSKKSGKPDENSTFTEFSERLEDVTEQGKQGTETASGKHLNQKKVESSEIHSLVRDTKTNDKEDHEVNFDNRSIDIKQVDRALNLLGKKHEFENESSAHKIEGSETMQLTPADDTQKKELHVKLVEKDKNTVQSKNISIADKTLQSSKHAVTCKEDNLCMLEMSEDIAGNIGDPDQKQIDFMQSKTQEKQDSEKLKTRTLLQTEKSHKGVLKSREFSKKEESEHPKQSFEVQETLGIIKTRDFFEVSENIQSTSPEKRDNADLQTLEKDDRKQLQILPGEQSATKQQEISAEENLKPKVSVVETQIQSDVLKDKNVESQISHVDKSKEQLQNRAEKDGTVQSEDFLAKETEKMKPTIPEYAEETNLQKCIDKQAVQSKLIEEGKAMNPQISPKKEYKALSEQLLLQKADKTDKQQDVEEKFKDGKLQVISKEKDATDMVRDQGEILQPQKMPQKHNSPSKSGRRSRKRSQNRLEEYKKQEKIPEIAEESNDEHDSNTESKVVIVHEEEREINESQILIKESKIEEEITAINEQLEITPPKYQDEKDEVDISDEKCNLPCNDDDTFLTKTNDLLAQQQQKTIQPVEECDTVETAIVEKNTEELSHGDLDNTDDLIGQSCIDLEDEMQMKFASKLSGESIQKEASKNHDDQALQIEKQIGAVGPEDEENLSAMEYKEHEKKEFPGKADLLNKTELAFESLVAQELPALYKIETSRSFLPKDTVTENSSEERFTSRGQDLEDHETSKIAVDEIRSDTEARDFKNDRSIQNVTTDNISSDASNDEPVYSHIYEKGPAITLSGGFLLDPNSSGRSFSINDECSEFDFSEENRMNTLNEIDIKVYNNFTESEIKVSDLKSFNVDVKTDEGKLADDYDPMTEIPKYWEKILVENDKEILVRSEVKCFTHNPNHSETQADENTKETTIKHTAVDSLPQVLGISDLAKNSESHKHSDHGTIEKLLQSHLDKRTKRVPKAKRMPDDMDTSSSDDSEQNIQMYREHSNDESGIETVANSPSSVTNLASKSLAIELSKESIVGSSFKVKSKVNKDESILPEKQQVAGWTPEKFTNVTSANQSPRLECGDIQNKETDANPYEETDYIEESCGKLIGDALCVNGPYIPVDPEFLSNPYTDPSRRFHIQSDIREFKHEEYSRDKWTRSDKIFYHNVMGCDVPESVSSVPNSKQCIGELRHFYDPTIRTSTLSNGICIIEKNYVLGKREINAFDGTLNTSDEKELKEKPSEDGLQTTRTKLKIVKVPARSPPMKKKTSVMTNACPGKLEQSDSDPKAGDTPEETKCESRDSPKDSPPKLDWYELTVAAERLQEMAMPSEAADECPGNKFEQSDSDPKAGDTPEETKCESRDSPKDSPPKLDWYDLTVAAERLEEMSKPSDAAGDLMYSSPDID